MYQGTPTKVLTGEVRLSYVHLNEPYKNPKTPNAPAKYSVTLLIPKTDTATKNDIDQSIQAAYEQGVKDKWHNLRPTLANPLIYDGDGRRRDGSEFTEECKGHWVITASSSDKRKPQVVDISNIKTELAPQDVYSGMYARVTINFFPFDTAGNKGVGCGLGNVLKIRDGEPLSGGASAASDFAGLGQAPEAAPVPQMGQPYPAAGPQPQGYAYPQMGQPAMNLSIDPITGMPR